MATKKTVERQEGEKDIWDKAEIVLHPLGGLITAITIAMVSYYASDYINRNQENEAKTRLYTELMSRREESESALRKDMFTSIIGTILQNSNTIDEKILQLELLAYNFHESLNMAGVWDLPIIYIVENNQYGMGTSVARASAAPDMVTKAAGYAIPARKVNGMDVIEVYNVVGETIAAIHAGQAPQFLEINTYRFEGHSMGDPLRYRTKDEVEKWREDDPIGILERHILKENVATKEELEQIDDEVEAVIEEAVQFAEQSPLPAPEALFEGIYVDN